MQTEVNPFQPPETKAFDKSARVSRDSSTFVHWPIVFAMNAIVPIIAGWGLSGNAGRLGILLACALILLFGWGLCYRNAESANRLIRGSLLLTFTQVFPVLQIAIGLVGLKIASWVAGRATSPPDDTRPDFEDALTSELEGFIVTFFVGATLVACAYSLGILLALISSKTDEQQEQTT